MEAAVASATSSSDQVPDHSTFWSETRLPSWCAQFRILVDSDRRKRANRIDERLFVAACIDCPGALLGTGQAFLDLQEHLAADGVPIRFGIRGRNIGQGHAAVGESGGAAGG